VSSYIRKHDLWPLVFTFSCSNDSLQFHAFSWNHHKFIILPSRIINYCVCIYIYIYIYLYTIVYIHTHNIYTHYIYLYIHYIYIYIYIWYFFLYWFVVVCHMYWFHSLVTVNRIVTSIGPPVSLLFIDLHSVGYMPNGDISRVIR
jgi:hypothetical protein